MPTYEYVCKHCEHEWEVFQSINEKPVKECPKCGKPKAKRQISKQAGGFILKGSGWANDGYSS